MGKSSLKKARDQLEKSGTNLTRGRKRSTVFENHSCPGPPAHSSFHKPLRLSSASTWGSKSSIGSFCRYWVLNHSSFGRSKTPLVRLTPESENRSINSFVRRNS